MDKSKLIAEFRTWVYQYCIDQNINQTSYSKEHLREIVAKASELYGVKVDEFSFACGFSTAFEILSDLDVASEIVLDPIHKSADTKTHLWISTL